MNENKKIGQKIRKARISMGITQNQLGKKIGKTGSAIGYLEAGLRKISPDVLKKIADVLNKPFKYFYEDSDEEFDLQSKIISFGKQLDELAKTVSGIKKVEKGHRQEFCESVIEEFPKAVIFINEDNGVSFTNKRSEELFVGKKKLDGRTNIENIIADFGKIFDQHEKVIKTNIVFQFAATAKKNAKKINFTAKSVYDKSGKYLGLWLLER